MKGGTPESPRPGLGIPENLEESQVAEINKVIAPLSLIRARRLEKVRTGSFSYFARSLSLYARFFSHYGG